MSRECTAWGSGQAGATVTTGWPPSREGTRLMGKRVRDTTGQGEVAREHEGEQL